MGRGADPNAGPTNHDTPLAYAVQWVPVGVIRYMLDRGDSAERGDLFHWVIGREGDDNVALEIMRLLRNEGADINGIEYGGAAPAWHIHWDRLGTPLHTAALYNKSDRIRQLLLLGADHSTSNTAGQSAIAFARERHCLTIDSWGDEHGRSL